MDYRPYGRKGVELPIVCATKVGIIYVLSKFLSTFVGLSRRLLFSRPHRSRVSDGFSEGFFLVETLGRQEWVNFGWEKRTFATKSAF